VPRILAVLPLLVGVGLGLCGCATVTTPLRPPAPVAWAHATGDLKPDPAVVWGRLENGLRYAILPHTTPQQRVSVTLLVRVGSYHERAHELGYAHFVEHLAFRDLRGFPDEAVWRKLQSLGVGPHANANVGLFETRYFFPDLPTDEPTALPTGLKILRAMADGVNFLPDSIERERGVVFSEQRSHDAAMARARDDHLEFLPPHEAPPHWLELIALFEGSQLAERPPLGEEKTLRAATARRLRAFYERWYRADRMIVVVAGDLSPGPVEQQIRDAFSSLALPVRTPDVAPLPPPKNPGTLHTFYRDAEPATQISLAVVRAHEDPDNTATRRRSLAGRLALAMFARRLDRAVEAGTAPFFASEVLPSHFVPGRQLVLVRAHTRPADWATAMSAIDLEVRRINELGFSPAEFALAAQRESLRTAVAARQSGATSSAQLAATLALSIARGVVFTGAQDDHTLTAAQLATLDEKQCHAAFRELLLTGEWALALRGPAGEDAAKTRSINFKESRTVPLTPYVPPAPAAPFPFTDFGPTGEVVRRERATAMDTELVQFANGVRLNLKRTRFEPGHAHVELRLHGGLGANPPDLPGLAWHSFAWFLGGLQGVSPEDLQNSIAGKLDQTSFTLSATAFGLNSRLYAENLPLMFQMGAAYFARPAFRAEAAPRAHALARQLLAPYTGTADGVALQTLWHRFGGGHPAYRLITLAELTQRTPAELTAWFTPLLASAPLEIGIVGDFDPEQVIAACARTFGALPPRALTSPANATSTPAVPPSPFSEKITFAGTKGVAVVALAWPVAEASAFPVRFRAQLLSKILLERISRKLRSELGETYSPSASVEGGDGLSPASAFLRCAIETAPARAEHVAAVARKVVATLARDGATADEFARARDPLVRTTESDFRKNGWWVDAVAVAQSDPGYGAGWAGVLQSYQAATVAEINALARTVLAPDRLGQLIVLPK